MILMSCFYFMLGSSLGSFIHEIYSRYQPDLGLFSFLRAVCCRSSQCHYCQTKLNVWHLVPVFSWLVSWLLYRRKTACCQQTLPSLYFWIEFVCGFWFMFLCLYFMFSLQTLMLICLGLIAVPIILIDCRYLLIPDFFQIILIGLALIFICSTLAVENRTLSIFLIALGWQVCSGLFAFLLLALPRFYYQCRYKIEAMGIGDLKLAFSLGLFLTLNQVPIFILLAATLGLFSFVLLSLFKKQKAKLIPFAPALVIAQWLVLVFYL